MARKQTIFDGAGRNIYVGFVNSASTTFTNGNCESKISQKEQLIKRQIVKVFLNVGNTSSSLVADIVPKRATTGLLPCSTKSLSQFHRLYARERLQSSTNIFLMMRTFVYKRIQTAIVLQPKPIIVVRYSPIRNECGMSESEGITAKNLVNVQKL